MALLVDIDTETGAVARYWRVIEVNLNWYAQQGAIALAGYLTKAARNNGKRPLEARQFALKDADFAAFLPDALDPTSRNPVRVAYEFVKTQAPFNTGTDD